MTKLTTQVLLAGQRVFQNFVPTELAVVALHGIQVQSFCDGDEFGLILLFLDGEKVGCGLVVFGIGDVEEPVVLGRGREGRVIQVVSDKKRITCFYSARAI